MRLSSRRACLLIVGLGGIALGQAVGAQNAGDIGGNIGVTSDYVYRGVSQTAGRGAIQGDLHFTHRSGWTIGAWGSHADLERNEAAPTEIDLYVSRDWTLNSDWAVQVTATHYTFPNDPRQSSYDYEELTTSLSYKSRLFASATWTPNLTRYSNFGFVRNQSAVSYEMAATQPLIRQISASAGLGYYDLPSPLQADYWFWNLGLACSFGRAQLALTYIDTDETAAHAFGYEVTGSRWAGSLAWRF
jgi:uncharacterized protein (TIGR02001 family)